MGGLTMPNRSVVEGEHLVVHLFPSGSLGLGSAADVRRKNLAQRKWSEGGPWQRYKGLFQDASASLPIQAVNAPSGAYLILKVIPGSLQQRYGLEEEEGAVFEQSNAGVSGGDTLRFYNGVKIRVQELRVGQVVEVLSLAGTRPMLYEPELQMR